MLCGGVLAREYGDPRYCRAHRMTVDAYAAQHPGRPERRTVRSINVHLASLYLLLDRGASAEVARRAMATLVERHAATFMWLGPPASPGSVRVDSVVAAGDAEANGRAVDRWARSVWSAWAAYHGHVAALVARLGS